MAGSASPSLPLRQTPASIGKRPIYVDDFNADELAGDTIPCSPGAVLRHDDNATTQPTQVLPQPQLMRSSSPVSVVEVPASSPFQQPPKRPLGSRLAPPGTIFRPPPKPTTPAKRPAADPIEISDDEDEDGFTPPRGDIRPTTFKSQVAAFAYKPEQDREHVMKEKLRQMFDVYGTRFPSNVVKKALQINDLDLDRACNWLDTKGKQAQQDMKNKRRLVSKASLQPSKPSAVRDSPTFVSSSPSKAASPSPVKPQKRRRLVQGLKNPSTPTPKKTQPAPPSSDDPLVIDLLDNDKEDAYQADRSPTPNEDGATKVLTSLNDSTLKELAAMTGMKEALLEPIIAKRPFTDLRQARKVSTNKTGRKSSRDTIGETVVEAIDVFLTAVESIDKVVQQCEKKARLVREVMETWDVNSFGHNKLSARNSPSRDDEMPLTPTSISSTKLCRPPIPKQPDLMDGHCRMKPFQEFGLNWMSLLHNYDIGCILADEMGLGKTCQVISFISHLVESFDGPDDSRPWPNLIIVPPSTYNNWLAEFQKFAPDLSVIGYRGSQSERAEIGYEVEQAPEEYHVVLGTYSQVNGDADVEALNGMGLHAAIFDEGHKMKNPETKIYRELRRVNSDWKMLLTGTPVQNNLLEMTSLLNFINPKMFEGYMEHIKYIFSAKVSIRDVSNGAFLYSERVKRARTILEPFILQRRKDQVLSDMPKKFNNVVLCDMTENQTPVYYEYEKIFKMEPAQRLSQAKLAAAAPVGRGNDQNNVWMQLRKAAIHPLLFRRHFNDKKLEKMGQILMDNIDQSELHQPDLRHLIQELKNSSDFELHLWCRDYPRLLSKFDYPPEAEMDSGKVMKLLELIEQYEKNGDRVLVFSKFSRVLELVREVLALKQIDHRVLMGNTNVSERQDMINEFNDDPTIPVFLLTTGAGGTGINLTSANKVIIFDQSDNPQDDIQAENRAHRLGQKRDVEVIRLISRGTLEELIHKACQKKIELANKVTGAVDEDAKYVEANLEKEVRRMLEEKKKMTPPQEG